MSYKQCASANRDALFGSVGAGANVIRKTKKPSGKNKTTFSSTGEEKSSATPTPIEIGHSFSNGYNYSYSKKPSVSTGLTGLARDAKLREAEDYRDKAKKAMQKGIFSRPDPLSASSYYKRAADAYQKCNEFCLERMYRISSADCQVSIGAFATAAAEYTRAAELFESADDETIEAKREIGRKCLLNASDAWLNINEPGKAADSKVIAARALTWGDESNALSKSALRALEEAIEAFVPDPLNPYSLYRQTGISAYINQDSNQTNGAQSSDTLAFAEQHIVSRPYAYESVQDVVYLLVSYKEYLAALYAQGVVSVLLSRDGISSLTLSRSFVAETILTLAIGDPIAAEQQFLDRHVQKTAYLSSRECKLAEDLFRAVKMRDDDALEDAKSKTSSNRAAIGNLHESLREVVSMIRISGIARKRVESTKTLKKANIQAELISSKQKATISFEELEKMETGYEKNADANDAIDSRGLQEELNALDFGEGSDDSDLEDGDLDLR